MQNRLKLKLGKSLLAFVNSSNGTKVIVVLSKSPSKHSIKFPPNFPFISPQKSVILQTNIRLSFGTKLQLSQTRNAQRVPRWP